jgi:RHS repeat-associated protein
MVMPGRTYSAGSGYRYGFNGKENDDETNWQHYGERDYDPRIARLFAVDPLTNDFPELTPYQFASNRPIDGIDKLGLQYENATSQQTKTESPLRVVNADQAKVIKLNPTRNLRPSYSFKFGWNPYSILVRNLIAIAQYKYEKSKYEIGLLDDQIAQLKSELSPLLQEYSQVHNELNQKREAIVLAYQVKFLKDEKEEDREKRSDIYLFRGGSFTDANFTPAEKDTEPGPNEGWSTYVTPIQATQGVSGKAQALSVKKLLKLGFKLKENLSTGHVGIAPSSRKTLKIWAATKESVKNGGEPHRLTRLLKRAWVREVRIK